MKKKYWITGLLALVLLIPAGIKPALAYFTGTTSASGGYVVNFGFDTGIYEEVKNLEKTVRITNEEGSDVFVRAKAFVGSEYSFEYSGTDNWTEEDGWLVYGKTLSEGESATFKVTVVGVPEEMIDGDQFNVAVVYESTPVQYKDGNPYADWNYAYEIVTTPEGGNNG